MALMLNLKLSIDLESELVAITTTMWDIGRFPSPTLSIDQGDVCLQVVYPKADLDSMKNDMYLGSIKKLMYDPDHCDVLFLDEKVESYNKCKAVLTDVKEILVGAMTFIQAPWSVGAECSNGGCADTVLALRFSQSDNRVEFVSNTFSTSLVNGLMSLVSCKG